MNILKIFRLDKNKNKKKKKNVVWAGKEYKCDDYHFNFDGTLTLYCGLFIRILEKEPAIYHPPQDITDYNDRLKSK